MTPLPKHLEALRDEFPQISQHLTPKEMSDEILNSLKNATKVVGWYAHGDEVRGPFCRWLKVTEVNEEYKKNVGTQADDSRYASACMNYAPSLAQAYSIMLKDMESVVKALEFFSKIKDGLFEDITESELRIVANEALIIWREKYSKQSEGL